MYDNMGLMKIIRIHKSVINDMMKLDFRLKIRISELLDLLAAGESLGMPVSRPMPEIETSVHELRIKDGSGQYRIFYYTKLKDSIVVFHLFKKKTQTTAKREIATAKKRLKGMI
jgi:phage-related protein